MAEYAPQTHPEDRSPHPSRTVRSTKTIVAQDNQTGILTAMVVFVLLALGGFVLWTVGQDSASQGNAARDAAALETDIDPAGKSGSTSEPTIVAPPEATIDGSGQG